MIKQYLKIESIPAILWGGKSDKLFIAIHGNMSNKADDVIAIFAEEATAAGYQVLSFDLPEHGERKNEATLCKVQNCVRDLKLIMKYAKLVSENISIFACSMGAYFSLLAYEEEPLQQSIFLSPVVDMERMIGNMCDFDTVFSFAKRFNCDLQVMESGEHYFHTNEQLIYFKKWVKRWL